MSIEHFTSIISPFLTWYGLEVAAVVRLKDKRFCASCMSLISVHGFMIWAPFFLATKVGLFFLLCVDPELSRGKIQLLGHITPWLLALQDMSLLLITWGWVEGVFDSTSSHFPGNQFGLLFWILKSETINSSCLLLNSEGSERLIHVEMREVINRGMTSARQSGGSPINLFSSLICGPSWSPEHWDLQL